MTRTTIDALLFWEMDLAELLCSRIAASIFRASSESSISCGSSQIAGKLDKLYAF